VVRVRLRRSGWSPVLAMQREWTVGCWRHAASPPDEQVPLASLGFDRAIDPLPPSLVRFAPTPPTCSKVRLKKSKSSCLRPSSRSNSAIRNSAALGVAGQTVFDGSLAVGPGVAPAPPGLSAAGLATDRETSAVQLTPWPAR
jgi:hypothetical protein